MSEPSSTFEYAVPLSLAKDARGEWVFSGPLSTTRRDFQGEVVLRNALQKGLRRWEESGMPFDFNHQSMKDPNDPTNFPGEGIRIYEDYTRDGTPTDFVLGRLYKHNPYARETKHRLDNGDPVYLSIGGKKRLDGATVVDTDINHVAITYNPANPDCSIGWSAFAKAMLDGAPDVIVASFAPPISESPEDGRRGPARPGYVFGQPYISKAAARYREGAPPVCCKNCTHYQPGKCEIVQGDIGEDDLCNHFSPITNPLSVAGPHTDRATWSSSKQDPGGEKRRMGKSAEVYVRNPDGSLAGRTAVTLPPDVDILAMSGEALEKMLTAGSGPGQSSTGGRSLVEEDLEGAPPPGRARRRPKGRARNRKGFPAGAAATAGNNPSQAARGHSSMGKSSVLPADLQEELAEIAESNEELSPLAKALSFFGFDMAKRRDRRDRAEDEDEDEGEGDEDEDRAESDEDEGGDESDEDDEDEEEERMPPARGRGRPFGKSLPGLPDDVELIDESALVGAIERVGRRQEKAMARGFDTLSKAMAQLAKSQASNTDLIKGLRDETDQIGRTPRRSQTGGNAVRQSRQTITVSDVDPSIGGSGGGNRFQMSPGAELAKSNDVIGTWVVVDRSGILVKSKDGDELAPQDIRDALEMACRDGKITTTDVIRYCCEGTLPDDVRKKAGLLA